MAGQDCRQNCGREPDLPDAHKGATFVTVEAIKAAITELPEW